MSRILNNSLTITGILGLLLLIVSFFVSNNFYIVVFTQILSIIVIGILFTVAFLMMMNRKISNISHILLFLGSGGILFSMFNELFLDTIMQKSIAYNISNILISLGILNYMNNNILQNGSTETD